MKKLICLLMVLILALGMCACSDYDIQTESEPKIVYERYVVIKYDYDYNLYLVYDMYTMVVYQVQFSGYGGFMSLYQVYKDGAIYGAIFDGTQIVPVPYAIAGP